MRPGATHPPVNDAALRRALLAQLRRPGLVLVEEVGLIEGLGRADVVALGEGLHGYELKGEADSTRRLPLQVRHYGWVLSRCTLVTTPGQLRAAAPLLPSWWGQVVAHGPAEELRLEQVREARANPRQQLLGLVLLLWRDELLEVLAARGQLRGTSSMSKLGLRRRLLSTVPGREVEALVVRMLRARHAAGAWR